MQNLSETIGSILRMRDDIEDGEAMTMHRVINIISELEKYLLDTWDGEHNPALDASKF